MMMYLVLFAALCGVEMLQGADALGDSDALCREVVQSIHRYFVETANNLLRNTNKDVFLQILEDVDGIRKNLTTLKESVNQQLRDTYKERMGLQMNRVKQLKKTSYVRWGSEACSAYSNLIYSGQAGGGAYIDSGAGVNALCLSKDPQWISKAKGPVNIARLFGAEYETSDFASYRDRHNSDVPCAVCETNRSAVLMLPGKRVCPSSWNREYSGYLMAGHITHSAATEYNCVDERLQTIGSTKAIQYSRLFYFTEAECGSLECPQYIDGYELTCVVCTK